VPQVVALLLALLMPLITLITVPSAQAADRYRCAGDPLVAEVFRGAVDAADIPNSQSNTQPGGFIVIQWRDISLQLPRTNNAGTPSYTDGRWWWQASDPDHPDFAQRIGQWETYACEASA
jgi:hypothetical protein